MPLLPRSRLLQDSAGNPLGYGILTLLLGAALAFYPFAAFGYLVTVLPWAALVWGVLKALRAWVKKNDCRANSVSRFVAWVRRWGMACVLLGSALALFLRPAWCDVVLWYSFAVWVALSALQTLKPAFSAGLERQFLWRIAGSAAALFFAALMLLRPRSGLSDALRLLGFFALAWGVYQLAIPRHKE